MKITIITLLLFMLTILACCVKRDQPNEHRVKNLEGQKVVLIVVDSLIHESLQKTIEKGNAPALKFFIDNGKYFHNLVSSYPTMSVSIDSSLLTGTYGDQHRLPGLVWYNQEEKRLINYGNGTMEIVKMGIKPFIRDSIWTLNNEHLSKEVSTIHEDLSKTGKNSASINTLIYRGNVQHTFNLPNFMINILDLPKPLTTNGPDILTFGKLIHQDRNNPYFLRRIGMNDKFSSKELIHLMETGKIPDFTIMYLPDNDHSVHKRRNNLSGIEKADQQLQKILNQFPTWEEALNHITWVIIGDSPQSSVEKNKKEALIDLRKLLSTYKIAKLGHPIQKNDQINLGVNERMAYVYILDKNLKITEVAKALLKDSRIAFAAWKNGETITVESNDTKQPLSFRRNGPIIDNYGQSWNIEGDLSLLDLSVSNSHLRYGQYPDGLARLYGALNSHNGTFIVVDAKPGYELVGESSPTHTGGGAHGSLHESDSLSPMIIAGTNSTPRHLRVVDLKNWILSLFNE
jgi:predicted AlkP superfamily pyrophosphatase or phosphodiesterase